MSRINVTGEPDCPYIDVTYRDFVTVGRWSPVVVGLSDYVRRYLPEVAITSAKITWYRADGKFFVPQFTEAIEEAPEDGRFVFGFRAEASGCYVAECTALLGHWPNRLKSFGSRRLRITACHPGILNDCEDEEIMAAIAQG